MTMFMTAVVAILGSVAGLYLAYLRVKKNITEEVIDVL